MRNRKGIPAKGRVIGDAHYGEERLLIVGEKVLNRVSLDIDNSSEMLALIVGRPVLNKLAVCIGDLHYASGFQFAYSWDGRRLAIVDVENESGIYEEAT